MVFEVLHMSPRELESHKLTYDKKIGTLLDFKGKTASTIGKESKSMLDVQAFVMSKEGDIYVGTHKNQYLLNTKNLVHGSFLSGRPAETAGVIRVNKNGKIDYISDNSGHYQPEAIDMYRGIKKIQETMPGVLDGENCLIQLHGNKPMPVSDFIKDMESKSRFGSKTKYETLREERIAKITKYQANLKNISKPSVEEQAAKIGEDLKTTLLERKQDNQKAAKNIAVKAREIKKMHR